MIPLELDDWIWELVQTESKLIRDNGEKDMNISSYLSELITTRFKVIKK